MSAFGGKNGRHPDATSALTQANISDFLLDAFSLWNDKDGV